MTYTLLSAKFNWISFIGISLFILLFFPHLSIYSYLALLITLHQFMLLFTSIGFIVPVRYLFGAFMCLQMLLGPTLAFNGLDDYQFGNYKMQVPQDVYFIYVIPAVVCFILGLHISAKKFEGEILNIKSIIEFSEKNQYLGYYFIAIGFISSTLNLLIPSEFAFVFTLLAGFNFIGIFLLILGKKQIKPLPIILVISGTVSTSLAAGMFHDLMIWTIFTLSIIAIKYRPNNTYKALFAIAFILLAATIQQLKGDYRQATWKDDKEAGLETLNNVLENSREKGSFFSKKSISESNIRINQGFIITNIMKNVPEKVPFSNGDELMDILEAAFMPRFLAPNKLNAGDRELFMKYSGMRLKKGTSMGLSSVGDAYINFGTLGGCIFMFFLGLLFSKVLCGFYKYSKFYPIVLLFVPLVFYYPIRPDCELQTLLGHLVKGSFLVFIVFWFWKSEFYEKPVHRLQTTN